ncbi:MAG: hypothetical protein WBK28_01010 [Minisyncoccia bacterium]
MKKFLVTYNMPSSGLDEWMKKPEAERKGEEEKMKAAWDAWMAQHADVLRETAGVGKPKQVRKEGITDARNDLMLYSFVEGESQDVVAGVFKDNPHLNIPGAWIEVMPVNANIS